MWERPCGSDLPVAIAARRPLPQRGRIAARRPLPQRGRIAARRPLPQRGRIAAGRPLPHPQAYAVTGAARSRSLERKDSARSTSKASVASQPMQASVIDTP